MAYRNPYKKLMDALDIAASEGFEWDYPNAEPDDLYEAIEAIGYEWNEDEQHWIFILEDA
ncbi:MAG: hypothetical protein HC828_01975 [Blastochloris sp.]|nr:hypothetical protein [Blastochloris sp.]